MALVVQETLLGSNFMSGKQQVAATEMRSDEINRQIQALSGRDLQLWSITILIVLVLALGVLAMVLPTMISPAGMLRVEGRYLPQFFFGLIALILLFNVYVVGQKRTLNATRIELIRELALSEKLDGVSLIDPLTQLLDRRSLELVMSREVARANRLGSGLTVLLASLDNLRATKALLGKSGGDQLTAEIAKLMRETFRGSDTVLRFGAAEFLVIMPDTTEQQGECAVQRLLGALDQWNTSSKTGLEATISCGLATYVTGTEIADLVRTAEQKLHLRQQLSPVFVPHSKSGKGSSYLPI
jgi:diguanylate cyclase (GGDEF)-like protein